MTPQQLILEMAQAKAIEALLLQASPQHRLEVSPADDNPLLPGGYAIVHVSGSLVWSGRKPPSVAQARVAIEAH